MIPSSPRRAARAQKRCCRWVTVPRQSFPGDCTTGAGASPRENRTLDLELRHRVSQSDGLAGTASVDRRGILTVRLIRA
jgi:hypothetical protein